MSETGEIYGFATEAIAAAREAGKSPLDVFHNGRGWYVAGSSGASGANGGNYGGAANEG